MKPRKRKIVKVETVNMIDLYQQFKKKKKRKEVRLGEFLYWLFRETKHN